MKHTPLIEITSHLVTTFLNNNQIDVDQLPDLIRSTHEAIIQSVALEPKTKQVAAPTKQEVLPPPNGVAAPWRAQQPAVSPHASITGDYLICLEDGKRYRSLKIPIRRHGLTPEEYKAKWGLPVDYPMIAPNYRLARQALAKTIGLGTKIKRNS